jgi:hypothetical protein
MLSGYILLPLLIFYVVVLDSIVHIELAVVVSGQLRVLLLYSDPLSIDGIQIAVYYFSLILLDI